LIPKENKNTFVQTSTSTLTFTSNMFFETFSGVAKLDGVELKAGDFTVKKGSTIITLSNSVLRKLDTGKHTLTLLGKDGNNAECNFYVSPNYYGDESNPKTGDSIFMPAMILLTSASALAVLLLNKKRVF
ncbi:MAG: hypothetical protein J6J12_00015, partial [Oscillospiraceae bacterium]|nr:hypothetical protein [Oscillospiraceae bacterium]